MTASDNGPSPRFGKRFADPSLNPDFEAPTPVEIGEDVQKVSTSSKIDGEALERLWRRGSKAWAGVGHPSAWVDELRGH